MRSIRSRSGAGHVPTWAYSTTVDAHVRLESGLEHDLLRDLDRDPRITWLASQPARVTPRRSGVKRAGLVPDLLSLANDGTVTVWAVRPAGRQNDKFLAEVEETTAACTQFGWVHRVFAGMDATRRSNLMWLDGFRQMMPWYEDSLVALRENRGPAMTLSDVLEVDAGRGHVLSAVWHALRSGTLEADLDTRFTTASELRFVEEDAA
ncbi:MAG: TnsA-like heteromeric transposase endonuclease subunit [Nocardioidaceae bacterium]|nr:TnsA-like heteromeric transposase endonuclease subunit [Nocardioidaceae bacterium]